MPESMKSKSGDFSRKRKLDFKTTFSLTLSAATSGTGSSLDFGKNLFYSYARLFGLDRLNETPHKSSFSRAKAKLGFQPFISALDKTIVDYQKETTKIKSLKWKGLRVYALDGTRVRLPATDEFRREYDPNSGLPNTKGKGHYPMSSVTAAYDVLSGMPITFVTAPCDKGEMTVVPDVVEKLNKTDKGILLMDRGYRGVKFWKTLDQNYKGFFLGRSPTDHNTSLVKFGKKGLREGIVNLEAADGTTVELRVIQFTKANGKPSVLVTNVPKHFASAESLEMLYLKRWNIEVEYRTLKCSGDLEMFQSRSLSGFIQELYAQALARAIMCMFELLLRMKIQMKNGMRCLNLGALILCCDDDKIALKCCKELLARLSELGRHLSPNRSRKSFPRHSLMPKNRWNSVARKIS